MAGSPRLPWFLILALLLACGGSEPPPDPLVAEIVAAWPADRRFDEDAARERLLAVLESGGDRAGAALVAFWRERFRGPTNLHQIHEAARDREDLPDATWLAEHPSPDLDAGLAALATDEDAHIEVRVRAIVALARPGNAPALDALSRLALDPDTDPSARRAALRRIDRIGEPLPESLGELLYLPFFRLDFDAAGAFARTGDARAAGLVADGLRFCDGPHDQLLLPLGEAALVLSRGDPAIREPAARLLEVARRRTLPEGHEREVEQAADDLALALSAWIEPTSFDAARSAYLAGERRARELALDGYEAILAAPDEDLDFAAGALALTWLPERWRNHHLERLDRLCRWLEREIGEDREPRHVLDVLARRLAREPRHHESAWPDETPSSFLHNALSYGQGNCLGLTSLYLAIAERLDLPLHAVTVPGHVFVRYDDGTTRINVETTDGGREIPDEGYRCLAPGLEVTEADVAAGTFLRNLTKREVLGLVAVNLSELYRDGPFRDGLPLALEAAEQAVALSPRSGEAWLARGIARFSSDPGRAEEALADIDQAKALHPLTLRGRIAAAEIFAATRRHQDALEEFDRALELAPEDRSVWAGRARVLVALGRFDDAIEIATARHLPEVELTARILGSRDGWRELLAEIGTDARTSPGLWMDTIDLLLTGDAFHAAEEDAARELLAELAWIETATGQPDPADLLVVAPGRVQLFTGGRRRYQALTEQLFGD